MNLSFGGSTFQLATEPAAAGASAGIKIVPPPFGAGGPAGLETMGPLIVPNRFVTDRVDYGDVSSPLPVASIFTDPLGRLDFESEAGFGFLQGGEEVSIELISGGALSGMNLGIGGSTLKLLADPAAAGACAGIKIVPSPFGAGEPAGLAVMGGGSFFAPAGINTNKLEFECCGLVAELCDDDYSIGPALDFCDDGLPLDGMPRLEFMSPGGFEFDDGEVEVDIELSSVPAGALFAIKSAIKVGDGIFLGPGPTPNQDVIATDLEQLIFGHFPSPFDFTDFGNFKMGIGTTSPQEMLDVNGNIHASGNITSGNSITIDGINDRITATSGTINFDDENLVTNGNVGIGTTNPTEELDVAGTVQMTAFKLPTGATNGHVLTSDGSGDGTWQSLPSIASDNDWTVGSGIMYPANLADNVAIGKTTTNARLDVETSDAEIAHFTRTNTIGGNIRIGTETTKASITGYGSTGTVPDGLSFGTAATFNALAIASNGNVGIGTTSPTAVLDVRSNTDPPIEWGSLTNPFARMTYTVGTEIAQLYGLSGHALSFGANGVSERMLIDFDGNVGIGTTSPNARLEVKTSDAEIAHFTRTSTIGGNIRIGTENTKASITGYGSSGTVPNGLSFGTAATSNALAIASDGNVGIGTTSPTAILDVRSNTDPPIEWGSLENPFARMTYTVATEIAQLYGLTGHALSFGANGVSERMLIDFAGNVGIGTTTPSEKLHVIGDINANGTIYPSDRRFKKDIHQLNNTLDNIKKLQGVSYLYKVENFKERGFSKGTKLGLLAQNLEEVYPELVKTYADGYKGVNYDGLIPVLIEAIKEQQQQNRKAGK